MDEKYLPALTSQMLPHAVDGAIADQEQSCELPLHLQLIAPIQNPSATRTSSGQESFSGTMQGTDNLTLGSEVNCAPPQSSFGVEPIISSLAALQITTDAGITVDSPVPLSLASQSTNVNCCDADSSSHNSSTQEVLHNFHRSANWCHQNHSCEEFEGSCILCFIARMLPNSYAANEAEDALDLTVKSSASAASSRESNPPTPLYPGYHQGVWSCKR
ncbi:unnamed protein product [Taenia asiatica]|uniref:Uncharacterized protein n=1 Tax=Taenia asiatica TaxID=60517 RepID=A0A0R3WC37_TAEAS|nr:unnamed protein product [Taenia asiatica]